MHVEHAFEDLVSEVLDVLCVHGVGIVPDDVHQILGAILKHKVELIEVVRVLWPHQGLQLDDVLVTSEDS